MGEAHFIFTDEAGAYSKRPSKPFLAAAIPSTYVQMSLLQPCGRQALFAIYLHSDLRIHATLLSGRK